MQIQSRGDDWYDDTGAVLPATVVTAPQRRTRRRWRLAAACALAAALLTGAGAVGLAHQRSDAEAAARQDEVRDEAVRHLSADVNANDLGPGRRDGLQSVVRMTRRTATLLFGERGGLTLAFANSTSVDLVRDVPDGGGQWVDNVPARDGSRAHLDLHVAMGAKVPD